MFRFNEIKVETPEPEIPLTDIEAFRVKLYAEDSPVEESVRDWFMKAATEQHGWKNGYFADYLGLEWLIDAYADTTPGECAWINARGEILSCRWAHHDSVCEGFLGKIEEVERTHARLTHQTYSILDALRYVDKQTDKMIIACHEFGARYPNIYTWANPGQFK